MPMFEWLKNPSAVKEIIKLFFTLLKVMSKTGVLKVIRESGSIEIFEVDGGLVVGLNTNSSYTAVKECITKLGDELKDLNLPTCSINYDGKVITVQFNEAHKVEMAKVVG